MLKNSFKVGKATPKLIIALVGNPLIVQWPPAGFDGRIRCESDCQSHHRRCREAATRRQSSPGNHRKPPRLHPEVSENQWHRPLVAARQICLHSGQRTGRGHSNFLKYFFGCGLPAPFGDAGPVRPEIQPVGLCGVLIAGPVNNDMVFGT